MPPGASGGPWGPKGAQGGPKGGPQGVPPISLRGAIGPIAAGWPEGPITLVQPAVGRPLAYCTATIPA